MYALKIVCAFGWCGLCLAGATFADTDVELELINSTNRAVDIYFVHRNGEELIGDVQPEATSTIHTYIGQHFVYRDALSQELVGKTTIRSRKQKYVIRKVSKSDKQPEKMVVERKKEEPGEGPDPLEPASDGKAQGDAPKGDATNTGVGPNQNIRYPIYASQVLMLVNGVRQQNGLAPVKLDPLLCQACLGHSRDMIKYKFFSHRSPAAGKTNFWQRASIFGTHARSENIAKGQPTPQLVMNAWMKSSGHRTNIMDPSVKRMGIGWVGMYWTQMFGQ